MCFFSSRRDKYGSIHPSVIVYQPFMGVKENMFLDKGCVIHEYARILAHKGKFVMKRNCVAATGLTVIAQNHDNNNIGDIPGGRNWGGILPIRDNEFSSFLTYSKILTKQMRVLRRLHSGDVLPCLSLLPLK